MYCCDICDKSFKTFQALGGHKAIAHKKQNCEYCNKLFSRAQLKRHEQACFQNPKNKKSCGQCGNLIHEGKKFCNNSCAAKYNNKKRGKRSEETKHKLSKKFEEKYYKNPKRCIKCDEIISYKNRRRKTCSDKCLKEIQRKHGSNSIKAQQLRSKNEKYFASLCKKEFDEVLTNENIFGKYDADVIIQDHKIAVLWNGIWHYKKITERHYLKKVQDRDLKKRRKIKSCGYYPYTIKDTGNYNKNFVKTKFDLFLDFIYNK